MKTEQRLVEKLSREALAQEIERIKEECDATAKGPSGIFPFRGDISGILALPQSTMDASVRELGWKMEGAHWVPPADTMSVWLLRTGYISGSHLCAEYLLYKAGYEEQSPEYILFFDGNTLRVIDFRDISADHQKAIKDTMAKWALRSIKQDLTSLENEECEGA